MSFDFNFVDSGYTPPTGNAMDLNFGPVDIPLAEVTLTGTLPAPTMNVIVNVLVEVQVTGTLPALTATFDMSRTVALLFDEPAPASSDLVFGEGASGGETGDATNVTLTGTLPAPSFSAFIGETTEVELAATLPSVTFVANVRPSVPVGANGLMPGLVMSAEVRYLSNTARPTVGQTRHNWQEGPLLQTGATTGQQDSAPQPTGWNNPWQIGTDSRTQVDHPLPEVFVKAQKEWDANFQAATPTGLTRDFDFQDGDRTLRLAINEAYEAAARLRNTTGFKHQDGDRTKRGTRQSKWENAARFTALRQDNAMSSAKPLSKDWWTLFQEAMRPLTGQSYPPVKPPPQPGFTCYDPNGDLLFETPWSGDTHLVFLCADGTLPPPPPPGPGETIIVPVKRVYIVLNTTTLRRVSDNAMVPTISMSLSLDVDSWAWSFSANLPGAAQSLVEPTTGPVELKAMVNGTEFRVLAESVSRERVFGQTSIRVSGRGRNAVLDAPYVPSLTFGNTNSRTAQQLMGDVLTFNGVPLGWAVNWELTDWVVPAGVFNHQGSYISALNAIVGAAGGYLLPHPSAMSFTVKHRYPTAPWNWASVTPDFELPAAVTTRESLEWREKPVYNRVYVSGQQNGILGRVTRATTDGALLAPMVVDPLVTAVDAARQRGRAILSDTGRQIGVGLRLPVLAETGVIQPGAFVEYVDGGTTRLGLVRGTSLEIDHPEVWQTLEVETHE